MLFLHFRLQRGVLCGKRHRHWLGSLLFKQARRWGRYVCSKLCRVCCTLPISLMINHTVRCSRSPSWCRFSDTINRWTSLADIKASPTCGNDGWEFRISRYLFTRDNPAVVLFGTHLCDHVGFFSYSCVYCGLRRPQYISFHPIRAHLPTDSVDTYSKY